ncbi:MAG: RluA family pseudouridine synthase [Chloroflexi bacterium]|nr:RluA family pseudouridine synthase [Chloroflexota bacterium]
MEIDLISNLIISPMIVSSKVPAAYKQVSIVDYLAGRFTYRSHAVWLGFVVDGRVSCNGRLAAPKTIVTQGDVVACDLPDVVPADVNFDYQILYEDEWLLGIDKPPNLRVHDKRRYAQANLIYHLRTQHLPPYPEVTLVNRLDQNTSGVILAARDPQTAKHLQSQFANKTVEKEYLAVVAGCPSPADGVIDLPLSRLDSLPGVYRHGVMARGKTAVTHFHTLQTFSNQYAFLQLHPKTGRTHQLRVHLAAIGHPILGDKLYRMTDEEFVAWVVEKRPSPTDLIHRQALHSVRTTFIHPDTERPCTIEAPLPDDMWQLLQKLGE